MKVNMNACAARDSVPVMDFIESCMHATVDVKSCSLHDLMPAVNLSQRCLHAGRLTCSTRQGPC